MKSTIRIFALCSLLFALCAACGGARAAQSPINAPTPTIAGGGSNNLTAFTGNMGAMNNNNWNQAMNPGKPAPAPDFGNCNALISRCATPKCASGGCLDMQVAAAIVNGCVQSNPSCAQHGDALVDYMAAQLVAGSTAAANSQMAAVASQQAANDAASQAAAAAQMQQMQQQMQMQMLQMQQQMAASQAESDARMQAALEQQRAAQAPAPAPSIANAPSEAAMNAAATQGVTTDVLIREQASGQILSKLDDVKSAMASAKAAMQTAFEYAGCDSRGDNCSGPKRVAAFRDKANRFFEPYDEVLDQVYDAAIMSMTLGVDITDIYMMLSGGCNVWGMYLCAPGQIMRHTAETCKCDQTYGGCKTPDGKQCKIGDMIPMEFGGCQPLGVLPDNQTVQQNWIYPEQSAECKTEPGKCSQIQVGCLSSILDQSKLFAGRRKQSNIDIELLQLIVATDAPNYDIKDRSGNVSRKRQQYCAVDDNGLNMLRQNVQTKRLNENNMCVGKNELTNRGLTMGGATSRFPTCLENCMRTKTRATCETECYTSLRIAPDGQTTGNIKGFYGTCDEASYYTILGSSRESCVLSSGGFTCDCNTSWCVFCDCMTAALDSKCN